MLRILSGAAALVLLSLAAGCGWVPRIPGVTPYKIDIQQGNFISQEMVTQLKPGMSKEQVRSLLGTPLLTDIFHAERWDYVYWRLTPAGRRESRRLVVFFDDNKLARVGGDVVPAGVVR
ncbi:MAG TPA: outer membrane protein assembly factor BamE [Burkholderiales bacterium]